MTSTQDKKNYIGRFAPSPSGALHFGSLMTALASYLDARKNGGQWLLRIDNIDPPREQPGAIEQIKESLQAFELRWDGQAILESERYYNYLQACIDLIHHDIAYPCTCSRKQLSAHAIYPGNCRRILSKPEKQEIVDQLQFDAKQVNTEPNALKPLLSSYSIRFNTQGIHPDTLCFEDRVFGYQSPPEHFGDFIIFRKDRLPSYMLACAYDDLYDGITHIVRGADLLDSCFWQRSLQYFMLGGTAPDINYMHLPIVTNDLGQKLSKQHHAPEIELSRKNYLLTLALKTLGQLAAHETLNPEQHTILQWAQANWQPKNIVKDNVSFDSLN